MGRKKLMVVPMPSLKIVHNSSVSPSETFKKVCQLFESDPDLKKLDPGYSCNFNSDALSGVAEGKQFKAKLQVASAGQGSIVEIFVELPFHLGLVKGLVQKTLEKKLGENLT